MAKRILLTLAVLMGGFFVMAQDEQPTEAPMTAESSVTIEEEEDTCGDLFGYCVDVELGQNFDVTNNANFPYMLARVNIPVGNQIGESQLWVLPEIGLFYPGAPAAWYRIQAVLSSPKQGVFIDAQTSPELGTQVRVGVRFGL